MTCIVGLIKGKNVWLGGDSAATDGALRRTIIKDPKVFIKGEIGFGCCGSPKVMDALAHGIQFPEQDPGSDDRAFLVNTLVPAIRDGLVRLDAAGKNTSPFGGGTDVQFEGELLLAYRGKLYKLQCNFQLVQSSEDFCTSGSGSELALGSLQATRNVRNPKKRILKALDAATANAGVAPPFVVITLKN